ncbi:MAG: hypothetical protein U9Q06_02385 [Nanoarchaeota archaeon]|nr:hypothetical protein [Nanoarchaeota archaeon]
MKKIHILIIAILVLLISIFIYILFSNPSLLITGPGGRLDFSEACSEFDGEWIEEYHECATDSASADIKGFCTKFNGEYKECESACRHESHPGDCIDVCVQVCSI